jgi:hypothetical protein
MAAGGCGRRFGLLVVGGTSLWVARGAGPLSYGSFCQARAQEVPGTLGVTLMPPPDGFGPAVTPGRRIGRWSAGPRRVRSFRPWPWSRAPTPARATRDRRGSSSIRSVVPRSTGRSLRMGRLSSWMPQATTAILPDQRDRPSGATAGAHAAMSDPARVGARNGCGRSRELSPCYRHPVANDIPRRPQAQVTEPRPIRVARRLAVSRYPTAHTERSGASAAPVNTSEPGMPGPSTMDHPAPS